jgi:hypothetical protein
MFSDFYSLTDSQTQIGGDPATSAFKGTASQVGKELTISAKQVSTAYMVFAVLTILLLTITIILVFSILGSKIYENNTLYYMFMLFIIFTILIMGFIRVGYDKPAKRYVVGAFLLIQLVLGMSVAGLSMNLIDDTNKKNTLLAFFIITLFFEGAFIGMEVWAGKAVTDITTPGA